MIQCLSGGPKGVDGNKKTVYSLVCLSPPNTRPLCLQPSGKSEKRPVDANTNIALVG